MTDGVVANDLEHVVKVWEPPPQPRWRWACTCGAAGFSASKDVAVERALAHRETHRP